MFVEERQLFFEDTGTLLEPLRGFKELPLQEEAEVDFFSFQEDVEAPSTMGSTCSDPWELGLGENALQSSQLTPPGAEGPEEPQEPQGDEGFCFPELSLCEEQLPGALAQRGGEAFVPFVAGPAATTPPFASFRTFPAAAAAAAAAPPAAFSAGYESAAICDGDADADADADGDADAEDTDAAPYVKQPRQGRYSGSSSPRGKRVSDSRLSAQGLAEVLQLDSPDEALRRERYILDIFETELHYPLGYKTWVRDTSRDYRVKLIDQLYDRVKERYPEYDRCVLETIIRRATYYMMQSRLRRERRARAKGKRAVEKRALVT